MNRRVNKMLDKGKKYANIAEALIDVAFSLEIIVLAFGGIGSVALIVINSTLSVWSVLSVISVWMGIAVCVVALVLFWALGHVIISNYNEIRTVRKQTFQFYTENPSKQSDQNIQYPNGFQTPYGQNANFNQSPYGQDAYNNQTPYGQNVYNNQDPSAQNNYGPPPPPDKDINSL